MTQNGRPGDTNKFLSLVELDMAQQLANRESLQAVLYRQLTNARKKIQQLESDLQNQEMEYRQKAAMMKARHEDQIESYQKKIEQLEGHVKSGIDPAWAELGRLNEIMKMSEDIFKKYEVQTVDSRRQLNSFKQRLKREDVLTEKLLFQDLNKDSNKISQLQVLVKEYQAKVSQLSKDKEDLEQQLEQKTRQLQRYMEENKQFSIVLSKRGSFAAPIRRHEATPSFSGPQDEYQEQFSLGPGLRAMRMNSLQKGSEIKKQPVNAEALAEVCSTIKGDDNLDCQQVQSEIVWPQLRRAESIQETKQKTEAKYEKILKEQQDRINNLLRQLNEKKPELDNTKLQEKIYDLEYEIYQQRIKIIKMESKVGRRESQIMRLNKVIEHEAKLIKQLRTLVQKHQNSSSVIEEICKIVPNLKVSRRHDDSSDDEMQRQVTNLVKAQDLEIPEEPTEQHFKMLNIVLSNLTDRYNSNTGYRNRYKLQRIMQLYIKSLDRQDIRECINQLTQFAAYAYPPQEQESDSPSKSMGTEQVKSTLINILGWDRLIPTLKKYIETKSEKSLNDIAKMIDNIA